MNLNLAKDGDVALQDNSLQDNELPEILLDIANYEAKGLVQTSLLLLDRYYTSASSIFQKALRSQLLNTTESQTLYDRISESLLPILPAYFTTSYTDSPEMSPIEELMHQCWLKDEVEGFEPHQINQNIILSFGT